MTAAALDLEKLRVSLAGSGVDVVDDVSFAVQPGQLLGLVGESGSGKTTVALAALAYARRGLRIDGGGVTLGGTQILGLPESKLNALRGRDIAYVAQDPGSALNPALTIGRQLREVVAAHVKRDSEAVQRLIRSVLEEVRLPDHTGVLSRYPHQLSGGQQQRVMLAMAFLCRPKVIVLDEPTTGLDVTTQRHVLATIRELCASHSTAGIYVSHDLAVVSDLVDQVAVMYAGRLVECGSTADIFGSAAHPYTRLLLAAVPTLSGAEVLVGIQGQPPRPTDRPPGCPFAPRCPLRIDTCEQSMPEPTIPRGDHVVRCYRAGQPLPSASATERTAAPSGTSSLARPSPLLEVADLRADYGGTEVVHGISLALAEGECLAIVGESGSGKTTLARCVAGAHSAWRGEVNLRGETLARRARDRSMEQSRTIQYVFQNPYASLNPRRTVAAILDQPIERFTGAPADERRELAVQALEDAALGERFLDRYPTQLSGGERQRVAIARALVAMPSLILCDEVTSALDVSVQASVVTLLRHLQTERSLSLLFITHNLALVRAVADRVAVLADGRLCEAGTVKQVLEQPEHEYTQRLMQDVPRLKHYTAGGVSG